MRNLVLVQVRLLRELLAARLARERLLTGVHHKVSLQIGQLIEALVARLADERPLAGVDLLVLVQAALRRERLLAIQALEALRHFRRVTDQYVRIQLRYGGEILWQNVCVSMLFDSHQEKSCTRLH